MTFMVMTLMVYLYSGSNRATNTLQNVAEGMHLLSIRLILSRCIASLQQQSLERCTAANGTNTFEFRV